MLNKKISHRSRNPLKAIFLTRCGNSFAGAGGKHRGYQINFDLIEALGEENVSTFYLGEWREAKITPTRSIFARGVNRLAYRAQRRWYKTLSFLENPARLVFPTTYSKYHFHDRNPWHDYFQLLASISKPAFCVVDDTRLAKAIVMNRKFNVPTIFCPHNLESLDTGLPTSPGKFPISQGIDLVHEINIFAQSYDNLFISKTECALIAGLGFKANYYPYLPVGDILSNFQQVAQIRSNGVREPGLFLLLGNANHLSTRLSMLWFLDQMRTYNLPKGIRVICAGKGTKSLVDTGCQIPGVEHMGWLDQQTLNELLIRVVGVLAPQLYGFGALTRLPEMSCAGIPVITSSHAITAIDPPPGVTSVKNNWAEWCQAIELHASESAPLKYISGVSYSEWEGRQSKALTACIDHLYPNQAG